MTAELLDPPSRERSDATDSSGGPDHRQYERQIAWATTILAAIAVLAAIYYAKSILLPAAVAVLLNLALKPAVLYLHRKKIPPPVSAAALILVMLGLAGTSAALVWDPAREWIRELPAARGEIADKLRPLREPVETINEASEEVEKIAKGDKEAAPVLVQLEQPGMASFLLNTSTAVLAAGAVTVVLLYFLLAGGDGFLGKLVELSPTWRNKRHVVAMVSDIQHAVSRYLLTITAVNIVLGCVIGIAMWLIGLPNPVLWGVMACIFNYVPIIGAMAGASIVFAVALLEYSLGHALVAPAAYLAINLLEGNFITPMLLGRSTSINPVALVLALTLWGWMWGIGGVFLAIPIMVVIRISCDHVPSLRGLGQLLTSS